MEATVDAIPPIRQRPAKLHGDKYYDFGVKRRALRARGIVPWIARPGVKSKERLGRHRWVVDRTHSWRNRFRRLKIRYERNAEVHLAPLPQ